MRTFTIEDAIKIQTEQLGVWKWKLNAVVYEALVNWATSTNDDCKIPDQIRRGSALVIFIENFKMY